MLSLTLCKVAVLVPFSSSIQNIQTLSADESEGLIVSTLTTRVGHSTTQLTENQYSIDSPLTFYFHWNFFAGKGDFEDGYVRGFRDANKMSSGTQARRRLDEDYGSSNMGWQQGYAQGLRDAGLQGTVNICV